MHLSRHRPVPVRVPAPRALRPAALLAVAALALPAVAQLPGDNLYTVSSRDAFLRTVNPVNGVTLARTTLTAGSKRVVKAFGLARDPKTGAAWVMVQVAGSTARSLGQLDVRTGAVRITGDLGDKFAGIAFDEAGVLFGVTGDGAKTPETLFGIVPSTASTFRLMQLGGGDDGEAIAFDPISKALFHASGSRTRVFEIVDVVAKKTAAIKLTGDSYDEITAATHWVGDNLLVSDQCCELYVLSRRGVAKLLTGIDHTAKGLMFMPSSSGGYMRPYGNGCPGSGGHEPVLMGIGGPWTRTPVAITVLNGKGGAPGVLTVGTGRGVFPLGGECEVHILPIVPGFGLPLLLAGTKPGEGKFTFAFPMPPTGPVDLYLQVGLLDTGRLVLTNPMQLHAAK